MTNLDVFGVWAQFESFYEGTDETAPKYHSVWLDTHPLISTSKDMASIFCSHPSSWELSWDSPRSLWNNQDVVLISLTSSLTDWWSLSAVRCWSSVVIRRKSWPKSCLSLSYRLKEMLWSLCMCWLRWACFFFFLSLSMLCWNSHLAFFFIYI